MSEKKKIVLLVDGNALIHRGFHAIPHLSTKSGEVTNGVYGFALLFLNALRETAPDYAVVCFDRKEPTFRDKLYEAYKAKRIAAPQELYDQIPRVKELVGAFNVPIFEKAGFEADDLIGTLARQGDAEGLGVVILTGDFDTLQLVNGNIKVFAPKKGLSETQLYGEKEVKEKYGLVPDQLIDYKALRGDPSDNIPGVSGIGDKTAVQLLQGFGDLDSVYKYLEENPDGGKKIKPRHVGLLLEHKEEAYLSRKLAGIVCDVPVGLDLKKAELSDFDEQKVVKIFQGLEFKSLLSKIPRFDLSRPPSASTLPPTSLSLGEAGRPGEGLGERSKYHLIDTPEKLEQLLKDLQNKKEIAIDTETTSQHVMQSKLVGIGLGWESGEAYYLPTEIASSRAPRKDKSFSLSLRASAKQSHELIGILENPSIKKIGHNIKYDYLALKRAGIELAGISFDTMIAAYLLNPGSRSFDLDTLAFTEFGYRMQPIEDLIGKGKSQITMDQVPVEKVSWYCCEDVDYTWQLKQKLEKELKQKKLEKIFYEIDVPLIEVLAEMEYFGIKVDVRVLRELAKVFQKEIQRVEGRIYRLAGETFNIGSPIQLKAVLFDKLHIPTDELKRGKTGYSTAATELEKMRGLHPIIDLISEWRELTKLKNTYIDTLPLLISKETGRIHSSFNQTIAATGRLSSSDPNLQNIPVRTELGRKIRGAFVSQDHFKLVAADYSQIELRIAAHLSGDRKMLKIFKDGGDIHEATAREIGVDRRKAKVINFGILYGLSAHGLTQRIPEVSREEAARFIERYKEAYPRLVEYLEEVIEETRQKGYVTNELGRIRNLPEINSSQFQVRSSAERAAINMPLQSLAADVIKLAMIELERNELTKQADCRLLLQVHDELLFEIKTQAVEKYVPQILRVMESVYKLKVPLIAEAKVGENWEKMEKLTI